MLSSPSLCEHGRTDCLCRRFPGLRGRPELAGLLARAGDDPALFGAEPAPPTPHVAGPPASAALLTAGIGDWFVIDSHLAPQERAAVRTLYYATRQRAAIAGLVDANPAYRVERHEALWVDFRETFSFSNALHLWAGTGGKATLPAEAADWSIAVVFDEIDRGRRSFWHSSYLQMPPADVARFGLPAVYVAVHPSSNNDRRRPRDFGADDWAALIAHLDRTRRVGVILGTGDDPRPTHRRLVDLTGRTTYLESVGILRGAAGFVGCASSLSVLAAQRFPIGSLSIKGGGEHLQRWKHLYYAPKRNLSFVGPAVGPLLDPGAIRERRACSPCNGG